MSENNQNNQNNLNAGNSGHTINTNKENKRNKKTIFLLKNLFFIGIIILFIYLGYLEKKYSLHNIIIKFIPDKLLSYLLKILGAYGVIQVLAQDLGVKTGKVQRDVTHSLPVQMILYWGMAFSLTDDRNEAAIGVLIYFYLKYILSENETLDVCFE